MGVSKGDRWLAQQIRDRCLKAIKAGSGAKGLRRDNRFIVKLDAGQLAILYEPETHQGDVSGLELYAKGKKVFSATWPRFEMKSKPDVALLDRGEWLAWLPL